MMLFRLMKNNHDLIIITLFSFIPHSLGGKVPKAKVSNDVW